MKEHNFDGLYKPAGFDFTFRPLPPDLEPNTILDDLAEQIMREKETACYEEFAAAIRKHYPGINCTGAYVAARFKELLAAEAKLQGGDCGPGCARYPRCEYNHGRHGVVRINCPLWRAKG